MKTITLYLSPSELAIIRNIPLSDVFRDIRQSNIPFYLAEEGIKIPVTYSIE